MEEISEEIPKIEPKWSPPQKDPEPAKEKTNNNEKLAAVRIRPQTSKPAKPKAKQNSDNKEVIQPVEEEVKAKPQVKKPAKSTRTIIRPDSAKPV